MDIHPSEKAVSLSVREFAEFNITARTGRVPGSGVWRAAVGTSWHRELEKQSREDPTLQFEIPLEVKWAHRGWTLRFQGRIDQLKKNDASYEIREVKSVSQGLPLSPEAIEDAYPDYLAQLATYCVLATRVQGFSEKPIRGVLLLVDIATGIQQRLELPQDPYVYFEARLAAIHPFLQNRWNGYQRRRDLTIRPPFPEYREGQEETRETLDATRNRSPVVCFEAPTGFGKTGMALEQALRQLKSGTIDRLIYLTSKSTGQLQALRQLEAMIPWEENPPRYFQIRNRREHQPEAMFSVAERQTPESLAALWERNALSPYRLLEEAPLSLERILRLSDQSGIPAYEITRAALPFADIWVGDLNYIFSPANRGLLENLPGYQPGNSMLIVDEAHNLPARVAATLSSDCDATDWNTLLDELGLRGAPARMRSAVRNWCLLLDGLKPSDSHPTTILYEVQDALDALGDTLATVRFDWQELSEESIDLLFSVFALRSLVQRRDLEMHYWSPVRGRLSITCLDASSEIRQQIGRFRYTLLMSATLHPVEPFVLACGLQPEQVEVLQAPTPWRNHAYSVAVDARVDTRWKSRERYYATTAETVRLLIDSSESPVACFFPSYRYAETIAEYLKATDPLIRVAIQPRGGALSEQQEFIETALRFHDALFLILGTGYTEGIDSLGGLVRDAMVVGPALPEVNAVQRAHMDRLRDTPGVDAFRRVYQIPAMQKINQALGRLVRAPGQSARVLLHCRRFAADDTQSLLAEEYRRGPVIRDEDALLLWLRESRTEA